MPNVTANEQVVLDVLRRQCRQGDPCATGTVRIHARSVSYSGVDRALRSLVEKGVIAKPSRGNYLLKEAPSGE